MHHGRPKNILLHNKGLPLYAKQALSNLLLPTSVSFVPLGHVVFCQMFCIVVWSSCIAFPDHSFDMGNCCQGHCSKQESDTYTWLRDNPPLSPSISRLYHHYTIILIYLLIIQTQPLHNVTNCPKHWSEVSRSSTDMSKTMSPTKQNMPVLSSRRVHIASKWPFLPERSETKVCKLCE